MTPTKALAVLGICVLSISGLSASPRTEEDASPANLKARGGLSSDDARGARENASAAAGVGELTLREALRLALQSNPVVAAARLSAAASSHEAKAARALANPEIAISPSLSGEVGSEEELSFSQPLEINGSRTVRGQIAAHEASAAAFDADATGRDIAVQVKQLYWDCSAAQQTVGMHEENIDYLDALRAAVKRQVDVGAIPGSQLVKAEVELARARQELLLARLGLDQAKAALNATLNRPPDTDFRASDPLVFRDINLAKGELTLAAGGHRHEVMAAMSELLASEAEIKAAKIQRIPDLALTARRGTFEGPGGFAVEVSLPILDWGSVRQDVARAKKVAQAQERRLAAAKNAVALEVDQAIKAIEATAEVVREFEGGILDKSAELARMAQKGYESGATGYLEVLEAQRTLRSVNVDYLAALADHAKAAAQLEWAAGGDIATIGLEVKQ